MASYEEEEILRGTTLEVYRFLLKSSKPVGVREIQRSLNLSSPSLAVYHLQKLEDTGLVKKERGDFTITKILLTDCIRISHFLMPRYLFYSVFTVLALLYELAFLRPKILTSEYFFFVSVTLLCALAFCFETAKSWSSWFVKVKRPRRPS